MREFKVEQRTLGEGIWSSVLRRRTLEVILPVFVWAASRATLYDPLMLPPFVLTMVADSP